ncbi:related to glyoxal oxidase precursor [Cephalotrichum gorgonifer]|uniref:Related to glyoxal oxidase n=1 Tax=Cephalotrichum gorgonifer TaxID=2041049 RepID=A0AAE8MUX3_9PEZI|nr:related to glyoxal oxidase precursor [Cephalotrichum gorgonifer]
MADFGIVFSSTYAGLALIDVMIVICADGMLLKTLVASGVLGAVGVNAFWRMECPHRVGLARVDPLLNPGSPSPHAHSIYGSSAFGVSSFFEQLAAGDCTSCRVKQDKSAYWHPQLYFKDDATNQYEEVNPLGGIYYFLNGEDIQPFKPGFRMIAGDNTRRAFTAPWDSHSPDPEKSVWRAKGYVTQDILKQLAVGVNCLNYAKPGEPTLMRHYLPDKAYIDANCPDGIRFEMMFPSCWVGGDVVDTPNHSDHVAYPDTVMDGTCPEGFPVRLPGLMFESFYDTVQFKDRSGTYVLSNGDVDGYGYHGDFISGWDEETLRQAINVCTNKSGRIDDCPIFNLQSQDEASQCNMEVPSILASEDVTGPMNSLPGNIHLGDIIVNSIGGAEDPALGGDVPGEVPADSAAMNGLAVEPTPEAPAEPEPSPVETSTPEKPTPEAPVVTEAPEPIVPEKDLKIVRTDYVRDGNVMSKIVRVEEVVYVTETAEEVVYVTKEADETSTAADEAVKAKRAHARMHRSGHLARRHH